MPRRIHARLSARSSVGSVSVNALTSPRRANIDDGRGGRGFGATGSGALADLRSSSSYSWTASLTDS